MAIDLKNGVSSLAHVLIGGLAILTIALAASAQEPAPASGAPLDPQAVRKTVESVAEVVGREYVDAEVAARIGDSLRQSLAEGKYPADATPQALAASLTRDLYAISHDKHLAVVVEAEAGVEEAATETPTEARGRHSNFGVQRVEILPGNVGYLNLTGFERPKQARGPIDSAMKLLKHADALIIDLRANQGGSPDTVALLASYFFETPGLELFEITSRSKKRAREYRTEGGRLPERDERRPVFLLTAEQTFSAGEGFAFLLQERRRAEIVGETTAGAANPGRPYPVNARFSVIVPNGRVRSQVSGRNWEGTGVSPDVAVSAPEALRVAHARALGALLETAPPGPWRDALESELHRLDPERASQGVGRHTPEDRGSLGSHIHPR